MFGKPMKVRVNGPLAVTLAPYPKEEAARFVADGGMQRHSVTKYLQLRAAPTIVDEEEWYEKCRTDQNSLLWGIWVIEEGCKKLIGNTELSQLEQFPFRQMVSGSVIFDQSYWGLGIATATHKARTWYAFRQCDLMRIKSAVMEPNVGSLKALERSGYFLHSVERNALFADGAYLHQANMECLNPYEREWSRWWGDDSPSDEAVAARAVTRNALVWADENVGLL